MNRTEHQNNPPNLFVQSIRKTFDFLPPVIVVITYIVTIRSMYWSFPTKKDSLLFCLLSVFPDKMPNIFERYFFIYLNRLLVMPFPDALEGFAWVSLAYHVAIILVSYLIVRQVAGRVQAVMAAMLTALFPLFFLRSIENFSDVPALLFGLAGIYFSLTCPGRYRSFFAGFFLAASIFSKLFGIVFIPSVIINLWRKQRLKHIFGFFSGALLILFFVAVCDGLWLNDPLYHLLPSNYLAYNNLISGSFSETINWKSGRTVFDGIFDQWFVCYLIYFAVFMVQGVQADEIKRNAGERIWSHMSIAIPGLLLLGLFTQSSLFHPGWRFLSHYLYIVFVPWILAFCSAIRMPESSDDCKSTSFYLNLIALGLSLAFVLCIVATGSIDYRIAWERVKPGAERFMYVGSLWLFILAIALVIASSNYQWRIGKLRPLATLLFILGCGVILTHQTVWAKKFSEHYTSQTHYKVRKALLTAIRQQPASIPIFIGDDVPYREEIKKSIQVTRKEPSDNFSYDNFESLLKDRRPPFLILLKSRIDELDQVASEKGYDVYIPPGQRYYGSSLLLVSNGSEDPEALFDRLLKIQCGAKSVYHYKMNAGVQEYPIDLFDLQASPMMNLGHRGRFSISTLSFENRKTMRLKPLLSGDGLKEKTRIVRFGFWNKKKWSESEAESGRNHCHTM